ncbi:hypothetical protein VTO73DRAFT_3557 [Trametes versicolor]
MNVRLGTTYLSLRRDPHQRRQRRLESLCLRVPDISTSISAYSERTAQSIRALSYAPAGPFGSAKPPTSGAHEPGAQEGPSLLAFPTSTCHAAESPQSNAYAEISQHAPPHTPHPNSIESSKRIITLMSVGRSPVYSIGHIRGRLELMGPRPVICRTKPSVAARGSSRVSLLVLNFEHFSGYILSESALSG